MQFRCFSFLSTFVLSSMEGPPVSVPPVVSQLTAMLAESESLIDSVNRSTSWPELQLDTCLADAEAQAAAAESFLATPINFDAASRQSSRRNSTGTVDLESYDRTGHQSPDDTLSSSTKGGGGGGGGGAGAAGGLTGDAGGGGNSSGSGQVIKRPHSFHLSSSRSASVSSPADGGTNSQKVESLSGSSAALCFSLSYRYISW